MRKLGIDSDTNESIVALSYTEYVLLWKLNKAWNGGDLNETTAAWSVHLEPIIGPIEFPDIAPAFRAIVAWLSTAACIMEVVSFKGRLLTHLRRLEIKKKGEQSCEK